MAGDITPVIQRYFGNNTAARAEWFAPDKPASTPHLGRVRLLTSEPGNVQAYGRGLTLEFELHHSEPVKDACFSFQILNQNAQPAAHLWLYSSDRPYARGTGPTLLRCEIPFVRLNVGNYSLRTYFSGPPGSPFLEMVEPEMAFEVTRLDQATLFGWRSEACAYFETASWEINPVS
jgi:lipopolysaccharide transport system ATP-binding protein